MDEKEVLLATLNSTISRTTKLVQAYEVEIANLTAEVIKLQTQIESMTTTTTSKTTSKEK